MAEKIDLTKIKEEIATRKSSGNMAQSSFGETVGTGVTPRDSFLHGLMEAYNHGKPTASSNLIKVVDNTVSANKGEQTQMPTPTATVAPTANPHIQRPQAPAQMSPDREEQMYKDFEKKNNGTLADSISAFQGKNTGNPAPQGTHVNYAGQQYLTTPPVGTPMNEGQVQMPMQLNEAALVESVQQIVNGHLAENLGPIFEEAIKGTVIEMFAVERIQEVLKENKDLIKEVVVETIKEIRDRSKKK
jgi:hypothetical protein